MVVGAGGAVVTGGAEVPERDDEVLVDAVAGVDLRLEPILEDQEANVSLRIWGGAVSASGSLEGIPVKGKGYVELSGYDDES